MLNECNGCEYKCSMSNIDICTLGSPCPNQRSTPMTNFENITKSEESLAEWLGDLLDNDVCDPGNWNCKKCFKWCHRDKVVEWLKQPHTEKE